MQQQIISKARVSLPKDNPAAFAKGIETWRKGVAASSLIKSGLRCASVIPNYINRTHGYCFPSDQELANKLDTSTKTVKRGIKALDQSGFIERQTMRKADGNGVAIGRLRRIYLTLPEVKGQVSRVKGHFGEVKGQKGHSEGTYGVPITSDKVTFDKGTSNNEIPRRKVGASQSGVYARKSVPPIYGTDTHFLDRFDQEVLRLTSGIEIGAGELESYTRTAFDRTTDSTGDFMPLHWNDHALSIHPNVKDWFRHRAGELTRLDQRRAS
jgi:hypothetical protein